MTVYDTLFDRVATRIDAERAHHLGFAALRVARPVLATGQRGLARLGGGDREQTTVRTMGLEFPHPLGLAAGFDKNAVGIDALAALGFGHVEIGTVTGLAQPGNPKPRLFRLPADGAIVNRMGFNNDGAQVVAERLARWRSAARRRHDRTVLGVNIGKSKVVPEDDQQAVERDYERSTRLLAPFADYLVVNVSSPNTPGLRNLQAVEKLQPLLEHVRRTADASAAERVPLLVKIAPDLADEDVIAVTEMAGAIGLDGLIATNTTISRAELRSPAETVATIGAGGLSGRPLTERSLAVLRLVRATAGPELTLIGVGGISTVEHARARLAAGADLIQAYSGFVYGGPRWPHRIAAGISAG